MISAIIFGTQNHKQARHPKHPLSPFNLPLLLCTMIIKPLQTIPSEDGSISSAEYRVVPMKSERKRQRSVSFNQIVSHNEVLHVNNYNKDERERTWYSREEFASMKIQCQVTVDLIEHGVISEDCENYCITGLEHRISSPTNIF